MEDISMGGPPMRGREKVARCGDEDRGFERAV
jgi:hypothetical protein